MKLIDWSKYEFRCSSLPDIMGSPKSGKGFSDTAKKALSNLWVNETFNRHKFTGSKQTEKGIMVESDSLELVSRVTNVKHFKNIERLHNGIITGEPDTIEPELIDIKSSWDIFTFFSTTEKSALKAYYWQMAGYMWLTKKERMKLIFVLVDTPTEIADKELNYIAAKVGENNIDLYMNLHHYEDIPDRHKIKIFELDSPGEEGYIQIAEKVALAREFLTEMNKEIK